MAAVVLYHLNIPWIPGGLLGVTMFFVISGYIITRLLLIELNANGTIDLKGFWVRRMRRLLPASGALIVVTAMLCTLFNHVMLTKMRPDILPSLLFFNNWWQILQNTSYFDALGDPSPLKHFWSLAIEEQFYLVWPPLLLILSSLKLNRPVIRRVVIALAGASAIACAVLYDPANDPSRLYYGTDTRAFSLLLGVWLAFIPERAMHPTALLRLVGLGNVLPAKTDAPERQKPRSRGVAILAARSLDLIGLAGLVGIIALFIFTNGYTGFQYQGGMVLCSLFTLMLVAACVQRDGVLVRIFSLKPLVWLGKRSYGIYLWHFPLLLLMNPVSDVRETPWWLIIVQLAVVMLVSEASYRLIETPCRHGAIGRALRSLRTQGPNLRGLDLKHRTELGAATAIILIAAGGLAFVPSTSALSKEGADIINQQAQAAQVKANSGEDADDDGFPDGSFDLLMVGDSVSLRLVDIFPGTFPHGHLDAQKSRQFQAGIDVFKTYLDANQVGKIAVFALGTNGVVTDKQIDELMGLVGDKRIAVFINTRSPQAWVGTTNQAIANAATRYKNVRVIDWYSYSAGRNDLFDGDGTHLSTTGAKTYLQLIYDNVKKDLPLHPEDHENDAAAAAAKAAGQAYADAIGSYVGPLPEKQ